MTMIKDIPKNHLRKELMKMLHETAELLSSNINDERLLKIVNTITDLLCTRYQGFTMLDVNEMHRL